MSKNTLFAAALAAALLAGCSSAPKTDPAIAGEGAGAGGAASDVTQVQAGDGSGLDAQGGPAGVGRIGYCDYDSYVVRPDADGRRRRAA